MTIPIFGTKDIEEIDESDLQSLKDRELSENRFIEYKRDMYSGTDAQKEEMLADISAFANAQGGYLFIGIEELSKANPIPKEIVGIENANEVAESIRNRCNDCIDEYIQGVRVRPIPLNNGKAVILVSIPNSPRKPHMVTYKDKNRFYIRRDEGKFRMSVEEIRDPVLKVEDYMRKLEDFLENRRIEVKEELFQIPPSIGTCWMVLSACPVFISEEKLDVAKEDEIIRLMRHFELPSRLNDRLSETVVSGTPKITLHGLRSEDLSNYKGYGSGQYLEVYNDGYIEFGFSLEEFSKHKQETIYGNRHDETSLRTYLIPIPNIPDVIVSFCFFVNKVWKIMRISEPIVYKLMFLNCHHITLHTGVLPTFWPKPELIIKPMKFYMTETPLQIAKELITKLFRAFETLEPNYRDERVGSYKPLFDELGKYKP